MSECTPLVSGGYPDTKINFVTQSPDLLQAAQDALLKAISRTGINSDFSIVCSALADLQAALVDESTEHGPLSPRLHAALQASWGKWTPSDNDPTVNLRARP